MPPTSQPSETEIRDALARVVSDGIFKKSGTSTRLLEYLVNETISGRSAKIKAYSIGLDVFGKNEEFDPSTDASVRVAVGRLRTSLEEFYASERSKDTGVEIAIPKGSYIPIFKYSIAEARYDESATSRSSRIKGLAITVVAAVGIIAFTAIIRSNSDSVSGAPFEMDFPVVDVAAAKATQDVELALLAAGIREQLIQDLSHVKSIRVRDMVDNIPQPPDRGDYVLSTSLAGDGSAIRYRLTSKDSTIIWASTLELPKTDLDYYDMARNAAGEIAIRVAGESGAVNTDMLHRLTARSDELGEVESSDYQCLVIAFAFDATKNDEIRNRARECLSALVAKGSINSTVYAQYALVLFLDWSKVGDGSQEHPSIQEALKHARRSIQLDPQNSVGFEHLGSILSAIGKREEAIEAYEKGLEFTPWKPSLNFLLGWQIVLTGDWERGMELSNRGVVMSPFAPGYMRIPSALDAFRRGEYDESLEIANTVIQLGDKRGYVLAIAAAIKLGRPDLVDGFREKAMANGAFDEEDPMREVRNSYSNPSVIPDYEALFN